MSFLKKSDNQLEEYFQYELAPYPLSLFDEVGMRKTKKSALYDVFTPIENQQLDKENAVYVLDGGFLLHKIVWHQQELYSTILEKYVDYIKKHYNTNTIVVFDGYPESASAKSTKSAERIRRLQHCSSTEVQCNEEMVATFSQTKFLSNEKNKIRLISMLSTRLRAEGFTVKQAIEDADTLIVDTAIEISNQFHTVIVIGEDTDLLVLLTALCESRVNIYFLKPGRGKCNSALYAPHSNDLDKSIREHILFIHAFSGCDTTSALYRQGKMKFVKLLRKENDLNRTVQIFKDPNASPENIEKAGEEFLLRLYGAKQCTSLNKYRYQCFAQSITKKLPNLSALPPTSDAARMHSFRTYYQIQQWYGNEKSALDWGWRNSDCGLIPVQILKESAPRELLRIISCKCRRGCSTACSCRKAGLKCSILCKDCQGNSCSNIEEVVVDMGIDETDELFPDDNEMSPEEYEENVIQDMTEVLI